MQDDKFTYIKRTLSRTKRKDDENYVVNAIWNRLGDTSIKPVSQQYIRTAAGGRYFIDLYFPQLNIGIECDESHHKANVQADQHREVTIFDILKQVSDTSEYEALHVDVDCSFDDIEAQINRHVAYLRQRIADKRQTGSFEEWRELTPEQYFKDRHEISIADDITFRLKVTAPNLLFGTFHKLWMPGLMPLPAIKPSQYGTSHAAWFPALETPDRPVKSGWHNRLSVDGTTIEEFHDDAAENERFYDKFPEFDKQAIRLAFAKVRDEITHQSAFKFMGVFVYKGWIDNKKVYQRIGENFPIQM